MGVTNTCPNSPAKCTDCGPIYRCPNSRSSSATQIEKNHHTQTSSRTLKYSKSLARKETRNEEAGKRVIAWGFADKRRPCTDQCRRSETRSRPSFQRYEGG